MQAVLLLPLRSSSSASLRSVPSPKGRISHSRFSHPTIACSAASQFNPTGVHVRNRFFGTFLTQKSTVSPRPPSFLPTPPFVPSHEKSKIFAFAKNQKYLHLPIAFFLRFCYNDQVPAMWGISTVGRTSLQLFIPAGGSRRKAVSVRSAQNLTRKFGALAQLVEQAFSCLSPPVVPEGKQFLSDLHKI